MASYWADKSALITGGSAGLGLSVARALLRQGAQVTLAARDADRLAQASNALSTADEAAIETAAVDLTDPSGPQRAVDAAIHRFGRLDLLVNAAGRSDRGRILETSPERFDELWRLNFLATLRCCQAAAGPLAATRGHVVNIGSLAAKTAPSFLGAYACSKFPIAALSQQLRLEWAAQGVHVLLVCPGPIRREDAGSRYDDRASNLPESARRPGGGAKVRLLDPDRLAQQMLDACERRQLELTLPHKAKWLFAISQLWPALGDWVLRRRMGE